MGLQRPSHSSAVVSLKHALACSENSLRVVNDCLHIQHCAYKQTLFWWRSRFPLEEKLLLHNTQTNEDFEFMVLIRGVCVNRQHTCLEKSLSTSKEKEQTQIAMDELEASMVLDLHHK